MKTDLEKFAIATQYIKSLKEQVTVRDKYIDDLHKKMKKIVKSKPPTEQKIERYKTEIKSLKEKLRKIKISYDRCMESLIKAQSHE